MPALLRGAMLALAIGVVACGDDDANAPPKNIPLILTIHRGNSQTVVIGQYTPVTPAVKVTSGDGFAVPGVTVHFEVLGTRGVVTGTAPITGQDGIASVDGWRMGNQAGVNTLTATVQGATPYSVTFTANGIAAPPPSYSR